MITTRKPLDDLTWRTSSFCNNSSCVEVAVATDYVAVRNSGGTSSSPLFYTMDEWDQFVAGVKNGEFDAN